MMAVKAQESATYDYPLGYNDTHMTYTSTANVTTATDSTWYYTVWKEAKSPLKYDMKVVLDSVSGTKQVVPIILKGKAFLSDSWTTITTVNWVLGHDTTIRFSETSTAKQYRYWQIYIRSARKAFIFKVTELSQKYWE